MNDPEPKTKWCIFAAPPSNASSPIYPVKSITAVSPSAALYLASCFSAVLRLRRKFSTAFSTSLSSKVAVFLVNVIFSKSISGNDGKISKSSVYSTSLPISHPDKSALGLPARRIFLSVAYCSKSLFINASIASPIADALYF